jgi:hypothetical protein
LSAWFGRKVLVRRRPDLASVSVWSQDDTELLCVAEANEKLPFLADPSELKAAIGEKRHDTKVMKQAHEAKLRIHETTAERITRLRSGASLAASGAAPAPADPYILRPVRSDLESHLNALQSADEGRQFRQAAGGETITVQDALHAYGGSDD